MPTRIKHACKGCALAWCLRREVCCFISLTTYLFVICFAFCKISFCFCKHSPALFSHWLQQVDSFLDYLWKYIIFFRCFNELGLHWGIREIRVGNDTHHPPPHPRNSLTRRIICSIPAQNCIASLHLPTLFVTKVFEDLGMILCGMKSPLWQNHFKVMNLQIQEWEFAKQLQGPCPTWPFAREHKQGQCREDNQAKSSHKVWNFQPGW